ncbi:MAG: hypothetical protein WCQ95_14085 [Bacteroidota bacterium]
MERWRDRELEAWNGLILSYPDYAMLNPREIYSGTGKTFPR